MINEIVTNAVLFTWIFDIVINIMNSGMKILLRFNFLVVKIVKISMIMENVDNIVLFSNTLWFLEKFKFSLISHLSESSNVYCLYLKQGPPVNNSNISLLKKNGVKFEALTFYSAIKIISRSFFDWSFDYKLNNRPPKIIVFTLIPILFSGILFFNYRTKITYVLEGLGRVFTSKKIFYRAIKRLIISIYKIIFSNCSSVITLNYTDAMYLAENKIASISKIKLIPGTGLDIDQINEELNYNQIKPKYIDFMARLIPEKGIYNFIYTRNYLLNHHVEFSRKYSFRIIAPQSDIDLLDQDEINHLSSIDIILKPYLQSPCAYYKESRAVIIPTMYGEGLSRVALECSYLGIPLLVSKNRGTEDFLPFNYKYFITSQNPSSIANQLVSMVDDIEYFFELRKTQSQIIVQRYSTDSSIKTFCTLI